MTQYNDIPQELFEQIEAYLTGNLSALERKAFAERLESEPLLMKEVKLIQASMQAVDAEGKKAQMNQWHAEMSQVQKSGLPWMAIAAGFALLAAVAVWFLLPADQPVSPGKMLFAQYSQTDPGLPVPMSASAKRSYNFFDAMVDYKAEKYDLAIAKWNEQLMDRPDNDTLLYYLGSAHFNRGNYSEAVEFYSAVIVQASTHFADKARLYLVLCWLQMEEFDQIQNLEIPAEAAYADTLKNIVDQTAH